MTSTLLAVFQTWIDARSGRERILLGAALALAAIWLVFAVAWQPLLLRRDGLLAEIADRDEALAVLQSAGPPVDSAAADDRPVPVIVTESAAEYGLAIRRLEPDGASTRIVLAEASFNDVIVWLAALEQDHGLTLERLEMTRQPAPGVVAATLTLER